MFLACVDDEMSDFGGTDGGLFARIVCQSRNATATEIIDLRISHSSLHKLLLRKTNEAESAFLGMQFLLRRWLLHNQTIAVEDDADEENDKDDRNGLKHIIPSD